MLMQKFVAILGFVSDNFEYAKNDAAKVSAVPIFGLKIALVAAVR